MWFLFFKHSKIHAKGSVVHRHIKIPQENIIRIMNRSMTPQRIEQLTISEKAAGSFIGIGLNPDSELPTPWECLRINDTLPQHGPIKAESLHVGSQHCPI
jgi:hypothetical protein